MPIPPAIQEVVEAFARAQLAANPGAAAALFAKDAVMYPPVSQAVVRGRPAIYELLRAVHSRLRIVGADYDQPSGDADGDLAHVHWRYALRVEAPSGGAAPATLRGRLSWVLKRNDGGAWRVAVHHASVDPTVAAVNPPAPAVSSPRADRP